MIPLTRKQEAAIWRKIGRGFEKYYETGRHSFDYHCWTEYGLCWALHCLIGSNVSREQCMALFGELWPDWGLGRKFIPIQSDAGVRALFAYLMAEVCPFTTSGFFEEGA